MTTLKKVRTTCSHQTARTVMGDHLIGPLQIANIPPHEKNDLLDGAQAPVPFSEEFLATHQKDHLLIAPSRLSVRDVIEAHPRLFPNAWRFSRLSAFDAPINDRWCLLGKKIFAESFNKTIQQSEHLPARAEHSPCGPLILAILAFRWLTNRKQMLYSAQGHIVTSDRAEIDDDIESYYLRLDVSIEEGILFNLVSHDEHYSDMGMVIRY